MQKGYVFSEQEYDLLDKLATDTKMDCWFLIQQDADGDYIYDLENDERMTLKDGVGQLFEGLDRAYEKKNLTSLEQATLRHIAVMFDIPTPTLI